jgi:hypothetical protein
MPYYSQNMIGGAQNSSHIYYNINISNDYSGYDISSNGGIMPVATNDKELQLVFNQSRAAPYLINPSKYYLSVQRFTIESPSLPVFICQPIVGQSNVNKSIYSITLQRSSDATTLTLPVLWQPDDKTVPIPSGTVTDSWQTNPYYYCHSYNHMVDLINNTFNQFVTDGFTQATPSVDVSGNTYVPYIFLKDNLFTVGGDVRHYRTFLNGNYGGVSGIENYKIYFNIELYNLLSSLKAIYVGAQGPVVGADYLLIMDTGTNGLYAAPGQIFNIYENERYFTSLTTNTNDVWNVQEYITLPLWSPIKNIIFRTTLLNVVPDIVATPIVFDSNNNNIIGNRQNSDILNIMVDYSLPLVKGTEYKPYIFYEPVGEFRLVDLYGNQPINSMDIAVFWKDSFGNLIPFVLDIGASATIKLLFRKKVFNSDKI